MNQQLSWRTIVGYSLGDVANNFAFAMGALFLLSYYTDVAGVGAAAAGTMLLLVRVFDAFADVFAGRVVDSVNTRWGKVRPFLLFGTAPLMIFVSPTGFRWRALYGDEVYPEGYEIGRAHV